MGLADELLGRFESRIQTLELIPSDGGRFEVRVNGELVFSKMELGRHAEAGEVSGILRKLVEK